MDRYAYIDPAQWMIAGREQAWRVQNVPVPSTDAERVQAAFDYAVAGDVEPLASLFDPDLEWRGTTRGHLWWRHTPS